MFLYNGEQSYSYADLLKAVCMDDYVPLLKTHDLFKYFSNLIKALVNNKPLVLLDSDLSLSELGGINEEKINVIEKLRTQKFSSMDRNTCVPTHSVFSSCNKVHHESYHISLHL
jgi:hypothetical protein